MGRLEFETPRNAWGGEATDFTPLLGQEDMLEYLGRECELGPLVLEEVEHATAGGRSLDILARSELLGWRIAIENQYGRADHDHLTRGLAYAVATGSRALVVIAEDHRDEFLSIADYLNRVAALDDDGITIWLVKVRAVRRVKDEIWSPEFVVMAQPNEWEATQRAKHSPVMQSLDEFYAKCESASGPSGQRSHARFCAGVDLRERGTESHRAQAPLPSTTTATQ